MRVLLAGAAGAIGRPLLPLLRADGHEVHATTRSAQKAGELEQAGAAPEVVDLLEDGAAADLVERVRPQVVIDELTSLPQVFDPRKAKSAYAANDRIREVGSGALIAAAESVGVERYMIQSVAFLYRPGGAEPKTEDQPAWTDAPDPFSHSIGVLIENERKVTESTAFTGVVLRYGFLYGPGTWFATGGSTLEAIKKRQYPLIGGGTGIQSLVHVSDAASATALAVARGEGIYNIVDDDPAPLRELVPYVADLIGAKPPFSLPKWLARLIVGKYLVAASTVLPGASNKKAATELNWEPRISSWRDGLRDDRDSYL